MNKKAENRNSIFAIMIVISIIFITCPIYSAIPWADTGNLYRQEINISGATLDLTELTHNFSINSGNVGANFNFSSDRNSLRFYYYNASSGNSTLISHYANSWNAGSSTAEIIIKVPFLNSTQNASIWMYYRNSTKSSIEDYCSVFIYCDLFDDASIDSRLTTTDQDTVAGTAFSEGSGVLSITAGGADTWTGSDQYGSVFVNDISGDVEVELAVMSITNTNSWTKAGIMFKNDMTAAGSSTGYVFNIWRPTSGYSWQRDNDNNGYLDASTSGSTTTVPDYLRTVKSGTSFSAYWKSTPGASWTLTGTNTISSTLTTQDIGISLTSHAGSTLATATYDNLTVKRYTTDAFSETFGSEEKLPNNITININNPSTSTVNNILQNTTIIYNATITCSGIDPAGCGNVNVELYRNITSGLSSVSTTQTTPVWTSSSNPQTCSSLALGSSCTLTWAVNATGTKDSLIELTVIANSTNTNISNKTSEIATIKVVVGNTVSFNQSSYSFGPFLKNSGNRTQNISIIADNGNNTNIIVECESGDCGAITDNWIDGTNLNEGNSQEFTFTCSDNNYGSYSAVFNVTSDEYDGKSTMTLSCQVDPIYGPINGTLLNPPEGGTILVGQNKTFSLQARVDCTGLCGNITAYALLDKSDWFDPSFLFRQPINISINNATPTNYQILLNLNSSNLGSNFDWSNSCNDIRFANNSNELDYWIENCNTSAQTIKVWIETDTAISSSSTYSVNLYYGNSEATSTSNASATFRNDEVYLITGACAGSGNCDMNNHAQADTLRVNINTTGMGIYGTGYRTGINDIDNPYGSNDYYFSRYRTLFIPSVNASHTFGTYTDDDSEVSLFPYDGYGTGIQTTHPFGAHDVVTTQYGTWHQGGACGSNVAIEGTRSMIAGTGYWIDFLHIEGAGGEDQVMCIDRGFGFQTFTSTNFAGEFYARSYVWNEPTLSVVGSEENLAISTTSGITPLWTSSPQPQSCIPSEDGSCIFTWTVNATGAINSSHNVNVVFISNISGISLFTTAKGIVNITNNVAPTVTLISPSNNSKIINSGQINFTWYITDDDINNTCNLYLDGTIEYSGICNTNMNSSYQMLVPHGYHTWFVEVFDSINQTINSSTFSFTNIINYSLRIEKKITSANTNQYNIETTITDYVANETYNYNYIDFVPSEFNLGSDTPTANFFNLTSGPQYFGRTYVWNLNTSITNVTYSLAAIGNYKIENTYILGLE